jgi:hypothetical protein
MLMSGRRYKSYPPREASRARGRGYPDRPASRNRTEAPAYDDRGRGGRRKRPRPSDPVWSEGKAEEDRKAYIDKAREEKEKEGGEGISQDAKAMIAGSLYIFMGIYLFFMFIWRDEGREPIMLQFAIALIVISVFAVFLALAHDLKFMPAKVSIYWTNFISGMLVMIVIIVLIKIFKDYSTGKYDLWDDLNIIVSVALGTGATYLLLHSMFFEKKEDFVQDRVPISFLSGFAWAGLGGFFYYFFFDEPFTRYEDAQTIFWISILMVVIASMAVFFNLLDNTYFAPRWATKRHMFFLSGILFGIIVAIVLVTALMFNEDPYEIWDTIRVCVVAGIGGFSMASGVFSMGM